MADFVFRISPNIMLGPHTLARIGQVASNWGSNFMLIADPILKEFGIVEKAVAALEDKDFRLRVRRHPSAATSTTLEQALSPARGAHVHGFISLGGTKTSSRPSARGPYNENHDIYEYLAERSRIPAQCPL